MATIWIPELAHYYVRVPPLDAAAVTSMRAIPSDAVLAEISPTRLLHPWRTAISPAQAIAEGDMAMRGEYATEDGTRIRFSRPFAPAELESGPLDWTLAAAALAVPDRLLKAFDATGNDQYLDAALDYVDQWQAFEEAAWLPTGLSWNDHALAERVYVLTDLWRAYRSHARYDPARGERILRLARRAAELLARPSHFTFATNHGVMQNLALMHVALAMPALPGAKDLFRIGAERLARQLDFYLSPDGAVLEHSAGYHQFGVQLLVTAQRYFELAGVEAPGDFAAKLSRAQRFQAALARPDGSLPLIGDTHALATPSDPVRPNGSSAPIAEKRQSSLSPERCLVMPVAGYSVWWSGRESARQAKPMAQVVATWSYFPGHGHKHADDLSIYLWADGQDWIAGVGYWSYGHPDRSRAEGWDSANAPHAVNEPAKIERTSRLVASACAGRFAMLDLERDTSSGLKVRRQLLQASPEVLVAIDSVAGTVTAPIVTNWTTFPGLALRAGPVADAYRIERPRGGTAVDIAFVGSGKLDIQPVIGSANPFGGWVFQKGRPVPAPGLIVTQGAKPAWTATVFVLNAAGSTLALTGPPSLDWRNDESWTMSVPLSSGPLVMTRANATIAIGDAQVMTLAEPAPEVLAQRNRIIAAFKALSDEYPRYRDLGRYRERATLAALALFALQLSVLFAPLPYLRSRRNGLGLLLTFGWVLGGLWLHLYYFAR